MADHRSPPRPPTVQIPPPPPSALSPSQTPSHSNNAQNATSVPPRYSPSPSPRAPHTSSHRQSWSQDLRGVPPSPQHRQRQPSMSQLALQELLTNPPLAHKSPSSFDGRDWKAVKLGEVIDPDEVRWCEESTGVEEATKLLVQGAPNVVLIRPSKSSHTVVNTYDYSDLNAYLLIVVGIARPSEDLLPTFDEISRKGREGKPIPVKDIKEIGRKEPVVTLPQSARIPQAVEIFGSGVHRIIITKDGSKGEVVGVLSQLRLVRFFWENGRNFPAIESLYASSLQDLHMGSRSVWAINGDRPLTEALDLMHRESITSLPVLDNHRNVVGNISHVDVKLLTKSTSLPLLNGTCIHFISMILSERGVADGKDSFPVFHVSPYSTLAHTVAKLVATRSHRMWIVDAPSPSTSNPPTPLLTPSTSSFPSAAANPVHQVGAGQPSHGPTLAPAANGAPFLQTGGNAVSASSLPGQHMSGRLSGVVSLTDVLNLFARASGLSPQDPDDARRRRRGSSSSSNVRGSIDSARSSSVDLSRSGSMTGTRPDHRR